MNSKNQQQYCILNNKIIPIKKANLSINHISIIRGYGIFESLRTYEGNIFLFEQHIKRLYASAKLLNIKLSKKIQWKKQITALLTKNKLKEARIQIICIAKTFEEETSLMIPTIIILAKPIKVYPKKLYQKGIKLITIEHKREFPTAKTTSYLTALKHTTAKKKEKAQGLLYTSNKKILEAATGNILLVKNKTIITPEKDILHGTTRNAVLEIAKNKYSVEQRSVALEEALLADEIILTATNKELMPVVNINNHRIGDGEPGPITKELSKKFKNYIKTYNKLTSSKKID